VNPSELLAAKRKEINGLRHDIPVAELKERISRLQEPARNLYTIRGDEINIIGEIRPPDHILAELFDPRIWGQEYSGAGCAAIAVCTDSIAHDGDRFHCRRARSYMPLPVVRFDYIIDEYQLYESRLSLADAVTITEAFLGDGEILHLLAVCEDLGIAGIVMVDDDSGARRAVELGAGYVLAAPLMWDYTATVPENVLAQIAERFPEAVRLIALLPDLTSAGVEAMAHLGLNAVMGTAASYDPAKAAVMLRQLNDIPRRIRE
jgi:indole-3-glycerol phosphate synthase